MTAARIVVNNDEIRRSLVDERMDQFNRAACRAEPADQHRRAVENVGDRIGRSIVLLVNHTLALQEFAFARNAVPFFKVR